MGPYSVLGGGEPGQDPASKKRHLAKPRPRET